MARKGDIANTAYKQFLRISGLTVNPTPALHALALQAMDDLAGELENDDLNMGYIQPTNYGESDTADESGLTHNLVGPFGKLLAIELLPAFGKDITPALERHRRNALRSIEAALVTVPPSQFPDTLPLGSGYDYLHYDGRFFDADCSADDLDVADLYKGATENFGIEWNIRLQGRTITASTFTADSGLTVGATTFDDTGTVVTLTADTAGEHTVTNNVTLSDGSSLYHKFIVCVKDNA